MAGRIIIIQGGQWGSEAKGLITAKVCEETGAAYCVRTGTVNAGHTVYHQGTAFKMQQLPVIWVCKHPTMMILGPGAYIHPEILEREIGWIREATGKEPFVLIDARCGLHLPHHTSRSTMSGRHHSMGATGKGCSEAVIDKIRLRGTGEAALFRDWVAANPDWQERVGGNYALADTATFLNGAYDNGATIVIEGTQGTLLDLHLGPYPFTTHKQTQAANWLAECGLSPTLNVEVNLVCRTFPIRVAGNSGPMPGEVSWAHMARLLGPKLGIDPDAVLQWESALANIQSTMRSYSTPEFIASEAPGIAWNTLSEWAKGQLSGLFERTTVTNKFRRIAEWHPATMRESFTLNRPTEVSLTFLNYLFPEAWGATRITFGGLNLTTRQAIYTHIHRIQVDYGVRVGLISFGPLTDHTFRLYPDEVNVAG